MHSGAKGCYLGTQLRKPPNSGLKTLTAGSSVHESRSHLNSQAVQSICLPPYPFPRSSALHQLTTATSDASMASFLRPRQDIRGTWLDSKVPSLGLLTYQMPVPPLSQSHICMRTPATSSVTRTPQMRRVCRGRNGKSPGIASTPQRPGLPQVECVAKALIRYTYGTTRSSSRGIIGIMRLSRHLPLVSPCPDGLVLAARSDHLAIGSPGDGIDLEGPVSLFRSELLVGNALVTCLVLVAWKIHGHVSCPYVPDFECAVLASCDQEPAVRAPGALVDLRGGVRLGDSMEARRMLTGATCPRRLFMNLPSLAFQSLV
jgi:hypothetical protein